MRIGGEVAASCSAEGVPTWDAKGGGAGGGNGRSANGGASCCRLQRAAAEPAHAMTITMCGGRRGGGSGGGAGLSGERQAWELAEWRNQGSELAEWRSQASELAESVAGCRTVKSGCRTVPAQVMHISTGKLWFSHWKGPQPSGCMSGLCMVCVACDCQCSPCFSRRLLQRTSQEAVLKSTLVGSNSIGQWVAERWPTVHNNRAPKIRAAQIWAHQGALLRINPRCGIR